MVAVSKRVACGAWLLLAAQVVSAQQCFFPYEVTNSGIVGSTIARSANGACSIALPQYGDGATIDHCTLSGDPSAGTDSGTCFVMVGENGPYACNVHQSLTEPCPPAPPPDEEPCEFDGKEKWTVMADGSAITGGSWCEGNCKVSIGECSAAGPAINDSVTWQCLLKWSTDEDCVPNQAGDDDGDGDVDDGGDADGDGDGSGDEPPNTPDAGDPSGDPGEKCSPVGDGEFCKSPKGDGQCGYVDDELVCLDRIKPDECLVTGSGARLCGQGANTTPPVPDNGTPGQPAAPDGQVGSSSPGGAGQPPVTNIYNYYGGGTVAGSSRDPGTTGVGVSSGQGASPGAGPTESDVGGELGAPASIPGESHDLSAGFNQGLVAVSGSCPEPPSVSFFGHSFTFDAVTWLCSLASLISGLVLVSAYLSALIIVVRGL